MPSELIGTVFAAYDRGDHVEIDCEIAIDGALHRTTYVVRPGTDGAPHHEALEAMLASGEIVPGPPPPVDLERIKAAYRRRVDQDAEACRLQFITPGAGMALTYQEKFAQANAVDDMGEAAANALEPAAALAQFPILAGSVGIEAQTLWACAQLVLARFQTFASIAGQIEAIRLAAKAAITAAGTEAEIVAIHAGLRWPTPQ